MISEFKIIIRNDVEFGIEREINFGNDSKEFADVEYITKKNLHLVIEAKTHESSDAYNTRHKIFGQLLKECGKKRDNQNIILGLLIYGDKPSQNKKGIPKSKGTDFYRKGFSNIPEKLFINYANLVNAKYIFVYSSINSNVEIYSWRNFYSKEKPIKTISKIKEKTK
jgi:hypothetical protein